MAPCRSAGGGCAGEVDRRSLEVGHATAWSALQPTFAWGSVGLRYSPRSPGAMLFCVTAHVRLGQCWHSLVGAEALPQWVHLLVVNGVHRHVIVSACDRFIGHGCASE